LLYQGIVLDSDFTYRLRLWFLTLR